MTYDDREKSRYGGQPIECFKFQQGDNSWFYTSADRQVILPTAGTFDPEPITRTALNFSQEDTGETSEITVARSNAVAALFIGDLPSTPVWLTIYRAHRGDEALSVVVFSGRIIRVRFEESQAILTGASLMAVFNRAVPVLALQSPCNHVLFSQGCGVNPTTARDSATIDAINGAAITSSAFALRANQWFTGGRLETPEGETRFIVDHVGDTVTLMSPLPGAAVGDVVWAHWGCDHLETTCRDKFSNQDNFLGWSRLPGRNPFDGRID